MAEATRTRDPIEEEILAVMRHVNGDVGLPREITSAMLGDLLDHYRTARDARVLNIPASVRLGMVCEAAQRKSKVRRLIPDTEAGGGLVVEGIARSIGDKLGMFARGTDDVRDCYLRVTTTTGFDVFWLVSTLADEIDAGTFIPNDFG